MFCATGEIAIAILAKAPIAGVAKTRLIPALGSEGAARLQERLLMAAVQTALPTRRFSNSLRAFASPVSPPETSGRACWRQLRQRTAP